jgi:hypothetical protein
MIAKAQKRSPVDYGNPLFESGILQLILSYVGLGQHLLVRPVSRWWKEIYATLQSQRLTICTDAAQLRVRIALQQSSLLTRVGWTVPQKLTTVLQAKTLTSRPLWQRTTWAWSTQQQQ